jgi:hypothetical protein
MDTGPGAVSNRNNGNQGFQNGPQFNGHPSPVNGLGFNRNGMNNRRKSELLFTNNI